MDEFKRDMARMQELIGEAFTKTGALVALSDGARLNPAKLQLALEETMYPFEQSVLELRRLCERYSPGIGNYGRRGAAVGMDVTGSVELFWDSWLHITLNTLLPHCRYQPPAWLSDSIRRLLDGYESQGRALPYYKRAMLVIDEHSGIDGRRVYDQDNKGWKAVCNALKGRVIPDDDQYTLNVSLLSARSPENTCHIFLMTQEDAADFFALRAANGIYGARGS